MSAYDHVHPDFQHILLLSNQERLEFLDEPRWIGYHTALQIVDTLQGLLSKPVRPRMPNLLLVGDVGASQHQGCQATARGLEALDGLSGMPRRDQALCDRHRAVQRATRLTSLLTDGL